jgi:hypothetical protein
MQADAAICHSTAQLTARNNSADHVCFCRQPAIHVALGRDLVGRHWSARQLERAGHGISRLAHERPAARTRPCDVSRPQSRSHCRDGGRRRRSDNPEFRFYRSIVNLVYDCVERSCGRRTCVRNQRHRQNSANRQGHAFSSRSYRLPGRRAECRPGDQLAFPQIVTRLLEKRRLEWSRWPASSVPTTLPPPQTPASRKAAPMGGGARQTCFLLAEFRIARQTFPSTQTGRTSRKNVWIY